MDDKKLVSFICVSMNHEPYVEQGLGSYLAQTYPNIEFLYLDNNSKDRTFEIADKLLGESGRPYQSFKRDRNFNLPENFNFLIKKAKGDYICLISCDDWVEPEYVSTMVGEYEKHPEAGLVYTNGWYYYQHSGNSKIAANRHFISGRMFDHIFLHGVMFPPGIMVKKETFEKVGMYDERIPIEDYQFWLKVAKEYEIGYSSKPMVHYRKHPTSLTMSSGTKYMPSYFAIVEQYKTHPLYKKVMRNFRKWIIYDHFIERRNGKALRMLLQDFRFERWYLATLYRMATGRRIIDVLES